MKVVPRFFALRLVDLSYFRRKSYEDLALKRKFLSLGDRFTIFDDLGLPTYQVEGSFLKIPKIFTISDMQGQEVSRIEKKPICF